MLSAIKNHAFYSLPVLNRNIFSLDLIPKDKHSLKIQLAYFTAPQFYKRSQVSLAKSVQWTENSLEFLNALEKLKCTKL